MSTERNSEFDNLLDEATLEVIARSVGAQLAANYGTNLESISSVLNKDGVELKLQAKGLRNISIKFEDPPKPNRRELCLDSVDDSEL